MNSLRYLNGVLTVLAVLLTLQLWTLWTAGPVSTVSTGMELATPAQAAPAGAGRDDGAGFPNASEQRRQIADLLKQIVRQNDEAAALWRSGKARVTVDNLPRPQ